MVAESRNTPGGSALDPTASSSLDELSSSAANSPLAASAGGVTTADALAPSAEITAASADAPPPEPALPRTTSKVQQLATSQLETRKADLAQALQSVGLVMRQGSQSLQQQGQQRLGRYAETSGEKVEELSAYLRRTDAPELIARARESASQRPALVAGGGFIVALLAARIVKSLGQPPQPQSGGESEAEDGSQAAALESAPGQVDALAVGPVPEHLDAPIEARRRRRASVAAEAATIEVVE